jgi:hypothetical protein
MVKKSQKKSHKQDASSFVKPVARFETCIALDEEPKRKSRRRKPAETSAPPRVLSEEEQRKQAAWREVEQTGKPVVYDDTLLIPEGMSPWDAIEFLPDGVREATHKTMQQTAAEAYFILVKGMRETILEEADKRPEWNQYKTYSYAVQMAIADSIYRDQNNMPEVPIKELLKRYGARIAD